MQQPEMMLSVNQELTRKLNKILHDVTQSELKVSRELKERKSSMSNVRAALARGDKLKAMLHDVHGRCDVDNAFRKQVNVLLDEFEVFLNACGIRAKCSQSANDMQSKIDAILKDVYTAEPQLRNRLTSLERHDRAMQDALTTSQDVKRLLTRQLVEGSTFELKNKTNELLELLETRLAAVEDLSKQAKKKLKAKRPEMSGDRKIRTRRRKARKAKREHLVPIQFRKHNKQWLWRHGQASYHTRPFEVHPSTILTFQLSQQLIDDGYFLQDGKGKPLPLRFEPMIIGEQYIEVWKKGGIKRPRRKARFKLIVKIPEERLEVDAMIYQKILQESVAMANQTSPEWATTSPTWENDESVALAAAIAASQMQDVVPTGAVAQRPPPKPVPVVQEQVMSAWSGLVPPRPPPGPQSPALMMSQQTPPPAPTPPPMRPSQPARPDQVAGQWVGRDWQVGDEVEAQRLRMWTPATVTAMTETDMAVRYHNMGAGEPDVWLPRATNMIRPHTAEVAERGVEQHADNGDFIFKQEVMEHPSQSLEGSDAAPSLVPSILPAHNVPVPSKPGAAAPRPAPPAPPSGGVLNGTLEGFASRQWGRQLSQQTDQQEARLPDHLQLQQHQRLEHLTSPQSEGRPSAASGADEGEASDSDSESSSELQVPDIPISPPRKERQERPEGAAQVVRPPPPPMAAVHQAQMMALANGSQPAAWI